MAMNRISMENLDFSFCGWKINQQQAGKWFNEMLLMLVKLGHGTAHLRFLEEAVRKVIEK